MESRAMAAVCGRREAWNAGSTGKMLSIRDCVNRRAGPRNLLLSMDLCVPSLLAKRL